MIREIYILYLLACVVQIHGQGEPVDEDLRDDPESEKPDQPFGAEGPIGHIQHPCGCGVGFSAYMSSSSATAQSLNMVNGKTLVFDRITSNTGAYNFLTGRFRAPSTGTYAFTWTICVDSRYSDSGALNYGEYGTQLRAGSSVCGYLHADTETIYEDSCSTAFVLCHVFANNYVYLRNVYAHQGRLLSKEGQTRTTFSGWKLFG